MNTIATPVLVVRAHAKINLFLEIRGRRPDGYHEIDTVMQTVSLSDKLTLKAEESERTQISLASNLPWLPTDERNTCHVAASRFLSRINQTAGLHIRIDKTIPSAAGLGGGSSDAAAVLKGLNKMFGSPLGTDDLLEIAAGIGADVPFCVNGGAVRCGGIGEIFSPCPNLTPCSIVIAIGQQRSSTPAAYGRLDEMGYAGGRSADAIVDAMSRGKPDEICRHLYNAFEGAILPDNPESTAIREKLLQMGALGALMSGSGASVYGIFRSRFTAEKATAALRADHCRAWVTYPIRGEM